MQACQDTRMLDEEDFESNCDRRAKIDDEMKDLLRKLDHFNLAGTVSHEEYITEGGFFEVYKGKWTRKGQTSPSVVAVRRLRLFREFDLVSVIRLLRELKICFNTRIDHPNCLQFIGFIYEDHQLPALVSYWMANGSLEKYMRNHPEFEACNMAKGIIDGVGYLHSRGIIHADLKTDNILLSDEMTPLVADYGLSRMQPGFMTSMDTSSGIKGTLRWTAPELYNDLAPTKESDVWSLGMTIYELLTRGIPYAGLSDFQAMVGIVQGRLPSPPQNITEQTLLKKTLWSLCKACWAANPADRPSLTSIQSRFYDPAALQQLPFKTKGFQKLLPSVTFENDSNHFRSKFTSLPYIEYELDEGPVFSVDGGSTASADRIVTVFMHGNHIFVPVRDGSFREVLPAD